MQLSNNFSLEELTKSHTAKIAGFTEQFKPTDDIISNLEYLCEQILEPVRGKFSSFSPSSGYRCFRLNDKIGGSKSSFHVQGQAVDIDLGSVEKNKSLFEFVKKYLPFTELIDEYNFDWVHIGLAKGREDEKVVKRITSKNSKINTEILSRG